MKKWILLTGLMLALVTCKKDKNLITGTPADYLGDAYYDKLTVEILYVQGLRPTQAALDNLKVFLQKHLNKPAGITLSEKEIASPGKSSYSFEDVQAVETANRGAFTNGRTLAASILYLDGAYDRNSANSKVLGIAYGFSSMAIFESTILEFSGGLAQPSRETVETAVTNHEFGHILGLVNNGTPQVKGHQDEPNGKHCDNENCLMYYAIETSDMIANLLGKPVPGLDENCTEDLRKAGGR